MKYEMSLGAAINIVVQRAWEEQNRRKWSPEGESTEYEQALIKLDSEITAQTDLVLAERERILAILYRIPADYFTAKGFREEAIKDIRSER